MDFEFNPADEDPHGFCKHEIHRLEAELAEVRGELEAFKVKEGPLNSDRWTLNELLEKLEDWKRIASGNTCVSFENLCFGSSSLWHQTHRENFRAVDRHPEELSKWVLSHEGHVSSLLFPKQVLEILERLSAENTALREEGIQNQRAQSQRLNRIVAERQAVTT